MCQRILINIKIAAVTLVTAKSYARSIRCPRGGCMNCLRFVSDLFQGGTIPLERVQLREFAATYISAEQQTILHRRETRFSNALTSKRELVRPRRQLRIYIDRYTPHLGYPCNIREEAQARTTWCKTRPVSGAYIQIAFKTITRHVISYLWRERTNQSMVQHTFFWQVVT